jgi:uncharacterized protein YndB with AHSA1/START domain
MSELRLERHYPVTPEHLFAFVTEPTNLVQWWGPEGTAIETQDLDLGRTGPWSLTFLNPGGGTFAMRGNVLAVIPPHAVEFTMNVPGSTPTALSASRSLPTTRVARASPSSSPGSATKLSPWASAAGSAR